MEYLILGSLIFIGRELSLRKKFKTEEKEDIVYSENDFEFKKQFAKDKNIQLNQPNVVSDLKPFFRSEKSQNTRDSYKDTRLSMFTGVDNLEHKSKIEIEAPKPVKELTNIHGSQYTNFKEYYKPSLMHNNVHPIEPENIGRGLGINSNQPASGGFHDTFRILPDNVNGYRKNNFAGTVIVGKSTTDNRQNESELTKHKNIHLPIRTFEKGKASVDAMTTRSDYSHDVVMSNREHCNNYNLPNGSNHGTYKNTDTTRIDDRTCQYATQMGNPSRERINVGYNNSKYITHDTQREDCSNFELNVNQPNRGISVYDNYNIDPTIRDNSCNSFNTGPLNGSTQTYINNVTAQNTQRQTTECNEYSGPANGRNLGHTDYNKNINNTMRGQNCTYSNTIGPASSSIQGHKTYKYEYEQDLYQKKEFVLNGYTPNQSRTNVPLNSTDYNIHYKNDQHNNVISSNPQLQGQNKHTQLQNMGNTLITDKIYSTDRTLYGINDMQLKKNPLSINILEK